MIRRGDFFHGVRPAPRNMETGHTASRSKSMKFTLLASIRRRLWPAALDVDLDQSTTAAWLASAKRVILEYKMLQST
jgi:hypothetical protein